MVVQSRVNCTSTKQCLTLGANVRLKLYRNCCLSDPRYALLWVYKKSFPTLPFSLILVQFENYSKMAESIERGVDFSDLTDAELKDFIKECLDKTRCLKTTVEVDSAFRITALSCITWKMMLHDISSGKYIFILLLHQNYCDRFKTTVNQY